MPGSNPRLFGEPAWGVDDTIYLPLGQASGDTAPPPSDPPALWLPSRDGYALTELAPPARPIGFRPRPKVAAR
jgi:hypothetical protein